MDTQTTAPAGISAAEWETRIDLAACYRLVDMHGWSDLLGTHISARVPGPEHHFLINRFVISTRNFMCQHSVSATVSAQIAI